MFRLAGVKRAATSLHFLVNLRTPDHFDAFLSLSDGRDLAAADGWSPGAEGLGVSTMPVGRTSTSERRVGAMYFATTRLMSSFVTAK